MPTRDLLSPTKNIKIFESDKEIERLKEYLDYKKRINEHQKMYPCGCGSTCLH